MKRSETTFTMLLNKEQREKAEQCAKKEQRTLASLIRYLLIKHYNETKDKE
jgi:hypothetical protein